MSNGLSDYPEPYLDYAKKSYVVDPTKTNDKRPDCVDLTQTVTVPALPSPPVPFLSAFQIVPPKSKALGQNPKDLLGVTKCSITKIPMVALLHESLAMMDGAEKYGAYNWRDNKVVASIYIDAAFRHLALWEEGEETADDSKVHHLGHARACLGILLDALETGNLIDDRPVNESSKGVVGRVMAKLNAVIKAKAEAKATLKK